MDEQKQERKSGWRIPGDQTVSAASGFLRATSPYVCLGGQASPTDPRAMWYRHEMAVETMALHIYTRAETLLDFLNTDTRWAISRKRRRGVSTRLESVERG